LATIGLINGEVDASKAISETDQELVIPAILAREAVLPYPKGRAYRSARELEDALFTFKKAWVTAEKHPEPLISIVTDRKRQIKGELSDIVLDADAVNPAGKKSPAVRANVHLFKKTLTKNFIEDVKSGKKKDVSVGFTYDTVEKSGEWLGEKYDFIQENLLINHVAVGVPVGRMRAPFIGLGCDSIDFEEVADAVVSPVAEVPTPLVVPPANQAPPVAVIPLAQVPPAAPAVPVKPEVTLTPTTESTRFLVERLKKLKSSVFF
jgi:hypothetical protein